MQAMNSAWRNYTMINKNNKNFQITLDPESAQLLESLAVRFNTSKSIIIRNALKVYAGKKNHLIKLSYSTLQEVEQTELKPRQEKSTNPNWEKDYDRIMEDLSDPNLGK